VKNAVAAQSVGLLKLMKGVRIFIVLTPESARSVVKSGLLTLITLTIRTSYWRRVMSNLDRTNVDAMHWAEQFCQHRIDNGWTMEDIDEGLMVGWFANYRFCVQDPLTDRIEKLEKEKEALRAALDKLARLGNEPLFGNSTGNVIAQKALESDKG
jgi:hypothetical protein